MVFTESTPCWIVLVLIGLPVWLAGRFTWATKEEADRTENRATCTREAARCSSPHTFEGYTPIFSRPRNTSGTSLRCHCWSWIEAEVSSDDDEHRRSTCWTKALLSPWVLNSIFEYCSWMLGTGGCGERGLRAVFQSGKAACGGRRVSASLPRCENVSAFRELTRRTNSLPLI